jgi:regulatory protein
MASPRPLSLKVKALQWLAQREHSRAELRAKLLRLHAGSAGDDAAAGDALADDDATGAPWPDIRRRAAGGGTAQSIDHLLDWLQARGHLSDDRFVESRVHARLASHGLRHIELELKQHGTALDDDTRRLLAATELSRAEALWRRKFGAPGSDPASRLRQVRFLVQRGFSPSVASRLARHGAPEPAEAAGPDTAPSPGRGR